MTEILVAVVILTLGIISMAELQGTALKLSHSSYLRSQAVAYSYQILDTMRSNREAALDGGYDWTLGAEPPTDAEATTVALRDLQLWLRALENAMRPYEGEAGITRTDGDRFTVTIQWQNRLDTERMEERMMRTERFTVVAEL